MQMGSHLIDASGGICQRLTEVATALGAGLQLREHGRSLAAQFLDCTGTLPAHAIAFGLAASAGAIRFRDRLPFVFGERSLALRGITPPYIRRKVVAALIPTFRPS